MKTIFIGDSHVAGMKEAAPLFTKMEGIFFAYPSHVDVNMSMLDVNGDCLTPTNDKLKAHFEEFSHKTEICLSNIDVVVLIGLRTEFPYKLLENESYSKQVIKQSMIDLIKNQSISIKLVRKIREINKDVKIVIVPNPFITAHLKYNTIVTAPGIIPETTFGKITKWPDDIFLVWKSALEKVFENIGVEFCIQNKCTITDQIFTQPDFAQDPHSIPGIRHMNKQFWEHIWTDLNKIIYRYMN